MFLNTPDQENPALINLEKAEQAVGEKRFHYLALGDRHSVTDVGSSGAVWYSGTQIATDFTEENPGFVLLVEVSADSGPQVQELALGGWRFVQEHFSINQHEDLDHLSKWLQQQEDKARLILRLSFEGSINLAGKGRLDEMLENAREEMFNLRFQKATAQLDNHARVKIVRREIAQLETVLRMRQLAIDVAVEQPEIASALSGKEWRANAHFDYEDSAWQVEFNDEDDNSVATALVNLNKKQPQSRKDRLLLA